MFENIYSHPRGDRHLARATLVAPGTLTEKCVAFGLSVLVLVLLLLLFPACLLYFPRLGPEVVVFCFFCCVFFLDIYTSGGLLYLGTTTPWWFVLVCFVFLCVYMCVCFSRLVSRCFTTR